MNNKLLIIGNGFDIDLGLRTSYSDYITSDYFKNRLNGTYNSLLLYLENRFNIKKWIDLENELKQYAKIRRDESTKKEFNDLIESLQEYLWHIKYELNKDSIAYNLLKTVIECGNMFKKIYTFNYTNLKGIGESMHLNMGHIDIEHVHGNINDKSIILGFEDEAEVHNSNLYMIKSFSPYYSSHSIQYDLDDATEVVFFGHSLGSSDYHYFESFFQKQSQIKNRKEAKKITIFTYNNESKINILAQLREMNNKRTDLLYNLNRLEILCTNEQKDQLKINTLLESLKMEQERYKTELEYLSSL